MTHNCNYDTVYNMYRALLYSTSAVYIRCNYPMKVFGTLMGAFRIAMAKCYKYRLDISYFRLYNIYKRADIINKYWFF